VGGVEQHDRAETLAGCDRREGYGDGALLAGEVVKTGGAGPSGAKDKVESRAALREDLDGGEASTLRQGEGDKLGCGAAADGGWAGEGDRLLGAECANDQEGEETSYEGPE